MGEYRSGSTAVTTICWFHWFTPSSPPWCSALWQRPHSTPEPSLCPARRGLRWTPSTDTAAAAGTAPPTTTGPHLPHPVDLAAFSALQSSDLLQLEEPRLLPLPLASLLENNHSNFGPNFCS